MAFDAFERHKDISKDIRSSDNRLERYLRLSNRYGRDAGSAGLMLCDVQRGTVDLLGTNVAPRRMRRMFGRRLGELCQPDEFSR
jgi:hypothetical protein